MLQLTQMDTFWFDYLIYSGEISHFITDCKDEIMLYDLVAVICHHGTAGGEYTFHFSLHTVHTFLNLSVCVTLLITCKVFFYKTMSILEYVLFIWSNVSNTIFG